MTEDRRLSPWGWFVRAFAAGFGATIGMVVAGLLAGAAYMLLVFAIASMGAFSWSSTSSPGGLASPAAAPPPYSQNSPLGISPYTPNGYSTPQATAGYGGSAAYPSADPYGVLAFNAHTPPAATNPPDPHDTAVATETAPTQVDDRAANEEHSEEPAPVE